MTPLKIEIMMHYHVRSTDYQFNGNDIILDALEELIKSGYIVKNVPNKFLYKATDKLHTYCEALCKVPEPIQQWVVPSKDS